MAATDKRVSLLASLLKIAFPSENSPAVFHGVLALLERSLRVDSRSWLIHALRAGGAMLIVISLSMRLGFITESFFGAPGQRLLRAIVVLNSFFLILLAISLFPTAISEEKEEETLGLMRLAEISPLAILIGKMGGRLFQTLLLIVVQYPFAMFAVTLGGVTLNQVHCAFVGMATATVFMSGLGLLCSTIASRNRYASTWMVVALIGYFYLPRFAFELQRVLIQNGMLTSVSAVASVLRHLGSFCMFQDVVNRLNSNDNGPPWNLPVVLNLAGGAICFLLAWALFDACSNGLESHGNSSGLLIRLQRRCRWFSPGRPRWNPYCWKDFHFVAGGIPRLMSRIAIYVALFPVSFVLSIAFAGPPSTIWWNNPSTLLMYQVILLQAVTVEISQLASQSFNEELREHTLAQLRLLPASMTMILYSKFAGAFLAGSPAIGCLAVVSFCTTEGRLETARFCGTAGGWFYLSHCVLVPHLAVVLSSYMRWGFVSLATGISICVLFGWLGAFQGPRFLPDDSVLWFAVAMIAVACLACHFWIARRIQELAAVG